jgi:hypothetical protein
MKNAGPRLKGQWGRKRLEAVAYAADALNALVEEHNQLLRRHQSCSPIREGSIVK